VSEVPGTTRDAIDVRVAWNDKTIVIIDTAGVRRRKQIAGSLDYYSQHRTHEAIERCDVALFLIDASREIARLDKQLAEMIIEACKPCVVVVNKWDLVEKARRRKDVTPEDYREYLTKHLTGLGFAPIVCMSALEACTCGARSMWPSRSRGSRWSGSTRASSTAPSPSRSRSSRRAGARTACRASTS